MEKTLVDLHTPRSAGYQRWLTPEEFNARFASTPSQVQAIQRQLGAMGLATEVVAAHQLHVTGSAAAVEKALGTVLQTGQFSNGRTKVVASKPIVPDRGDGHRQRSLSDSAGCLAAHGRMPWRVGAAVQCG